MSTPLQRRNNDRILPKNFKFSDLESIFIPPLLVPHDAAEGNWEKKESELAEFNGILSPSPLLSSTTTVEHFLKYQKQLENCIANLLGTNSFKYFSKYRNLLVEYVHTVNSEGFIETVKTLKSQKNFIIEMIKEHEDKEPQYKPSWILNPFIAIYRIMKKNVEFFENYEKLINQIAREADRLG